MSHTSAVNLLDTGVINPTLPSLNTTANPSSVAQYSMSLMYTSAKPRYEPTDEKISTWNGIIGEVFSHLASIFTERQKDRAYALVTPQLATMAGIVLSFKSGSQLESPRYVAGTQLLEPPESASTGSWKQKCKWELSPRHPRWDVDT